MARAYRVLGTTTDVTECGNCGRDDLRYTIVLQHLDAEGNPDSEAEYFGSDCGARAAGWTQREIRQRARSADDANAVRSRPVGMPSSRPRPRAGSAGSVR